MTKVCPWYRQSLLTWGHHRRRIWVPTVINHLVYWARYTVLDCHSSLWPNTASFEITHRCYSWPESVTVCSGQYPYYLTRYINVSEFGSLLLSLHLLPLLLLLLWLLLLLLLLLLKPQHVVVTIYVSPHCSCCCCSWCCAADAAMNTILTRKKLAAFGCKRLMWPNATTFERAQIGHSMPVAITVLYGQRPHYLKFIF